MTLLDPHLDVDQLSAAVDGEADPGTAQHLLACLACRTQVDAWRLALAPLRTPPVAGPADADPIVAALAAWDLATPDRRPTEPDARPAEPGARPARGPGSRPPDGRLPGSPARTPSAMARTSASGTRSRRAARWGRWSSPSGVAAALVAVVVLGGAIVGILLSGHGGTPSAASSAKSAAPAASALPAASQTVPLGQSRTSSGAASAAVAPGPATLSFASTQQLAAALRRISTGSFTSVAPGSPCLSQARRFAAAVPTVVTDTPAFTESVRLTGVASQVFVFIETHGHVAVALRSGTCSLLATVSF